MLSTDVKNKIILHAKEQYPKESCGLLIVIKGRLFYESCKNIAETPSEHFIIDPKDYLAVSKKGEIVGVVHSHPTTEAVLSEADKVACEKSKLPWYVVNPITGEINESKPSGFKLPYIGRVFSHGIVDCYTLLQDWYERELNIKLGDYDRRDNWWDKGENLYLDNYKKENFYEITVDEITYGDIIFMHLISPVPNHVAIYIGDNKILHHVQGRLSSRDVYGSYYQKVTAKILRHENH